ncbi:putative fluoride ion transporter CrcB 1 [Paenibacillus sp. J31TS4]|nr:putative fluoride ion transporter CrcB 1 [Paenibacillus sp. J31TS4]
MIGLVGLAGALGALLRYALGAGVLLIWGSPYPLATFAANLGGSFVLGWLTGRAASRPAWPAWVMPVLGTGLIGAFTTFSTFSVETLALWREGHAGTAVLYSLLSIWGGLALAWLGMRLGERTGNGAPDEREEGTS